ncbi:hypothetical protein GGR42_002648 [Saonia flava]|uniref:Cardiolipin synthetase n=1 Tax=Saonia flava TaxID=523696 RepID=A0A846QY82_9FLAO|nr:hypothetical protein [Saonia flava]NJB72157.1 hypothetical protein [Saonia flava]
MKKSLILLVIILTGCSSTHIVNNWKNPDIVLFDASKVLIVGMTQNDSAREQFETDLQNEFSKRGVESFRSIDLFDVKFTSSKQSEEELSEVEQQLLDKDFDAILFTKVVGSENKRILRKRISELDEIYGNFHEDYMGHQGIYYESDYYDEFKVYHSETSLYCICVGKERELIWRGAIDITDPVNIDKTVDDYVKLIVVAMEEQDLIFRKEQKNEITGL